MSFQETVILLIYFSFSSLRKLTGSIFNSNALMQKTIVFSESVSKGLSQPTINKEIFFFQPKELLKLLDSVPEHHLLYGIQ